MISGILDATAVMASNLPRSRRMEVMCVMWVRYREKLLWNKKRDKLNFKKNLRRVLYENSSKDLYICDSCLCDEWYRGAAYIMKSQIFWTEMHKFCMFVICDL